MGSLSQISAYFFLYDLSPCRWRTLRYTISARSRMSFSESFQPRQGSVMDLP